MSQQKKLNLCDYINLFTYFFFALIDLIKYFSLFCFSINYFLLTGETCNHFYFLFFSCGFVLQVWKKNLECFITLVGLKELNLFKHVEFFYLYFVIDLMTNIH
jgi:hypothetical protein